MKPEHKKIIGDLIDIFDDYEEAKAKAKAETEKRENIKACCEYNIHIYHRLCDELKSEIFSLLFLSWRLKDYSTYDELIIDAQKGCDNYLSSEALMIIRTSVVTILDIVIIFKKELINFFQENQKEETKND